MNMFLAKCLHDWVYLFLMIHQCLINRELFVFCYWIKVVIHEVIWHTPWRLSYQFFCIVESCHMHKLLSGYEDYLWGNHVKTGIVADFVLKVQIPQALHECSVELRIGGRCGPDNPFIRGKVSPPWWFSPSPRARTKGWPWPWMKKMCPDRDITTFLRKSLKIQLRISTGCYNLLAQLIRIHAIATWASAGLEISPWRPRADGWRSPFPFAPSFSFVNDSIRSSLCSSNRSSRGGRRPSEPLPDTDHSVGQCRVRCCSFPSKTRKLHVSRTAKVTARWHHFLWKGKFSLKRPWDVCPSIFVPPKTGHWA